MNSNTALTSDDLLAFPLAKIQTLVSDAAANVRRARHLDLEASNAATQAKGALKDAETQLATAVEALVLKQG